MNVRMNKPIQCLDTPLFQVGEYVIYRGDREGRVIQVFTHPTRPTIYRLLIVDGARIELDATASDLVRSP